MNTQPEPTERRILLVEVTMPKGRWSASDMTDELATALPGRQPEVVGSLDAGEVDAAFRKIQQVARETDEDRSFLDRSHSAQKAASFFRDMFGVGFWKRYKIGEPQSERKAALATPVSDLRNND